MSAIFTLAAEAWRDMRSAYDSHVEHAYAAALEATSGVLVNAEGRALGIDGYTLFSGPLIRARRYASWELLEHWQSTPRLSLEQFEEQWLSGGAFVLAATA